VEGEFVAGDCGVRVESQDEVLRESARVRRVQDVDQRLSGERGEMEAA
jgi:hypothetical protein